MAWECVFVWDSEWESGGEKGVSMTSLCLSWWGPKRLPAAAFKVALCVLRATITKPLRLGQWTPVRNVLSAWPGFFTYIFNLHACIAKMGHHGYRRHVWQLQSSERHSTVVTTVTYFLLGTVHLSVRPSNVIHVSSLLTQQFLNSRAVCAHMSLSASPHHWHKDTAFRSQTPSLHMHSHTFSVLSVSMICENVGRKCDYFTLRNYFCVSLKVAVSGRAPGYIIPASSSQQAGRRGEYTEFDLQLWKQAAMLPKQLLQLSEQSQLGCRPYLMWTDGQTTTTVWCTQKAGVFMGCFVAQSDLWHLWRSLAWMV